jgi:hypothetical protein
MGDIQNQCFQLCFNAPLEINFQSSRVTSDGSVVLVRELDERLGFGQLIKQHLTDSRRGKNAEILVRRRPKYRWQAGEIHQGRQQPDTEILPLRGW